MVRGATLIHGLISVRLRDTAIPPTADACLTLRNTLRHTHFLRTLRGPFDDLSLARLSATRALCQVFSRRYLRIIGLG